MAVPVDSFDRLWHELSVMCKELLYFDKKSLTWKDILLVIGGLYVAKKTFNLTRGIYSAVKQHGVARVVRADPVKLYGKWAGTSGRVHGTLVDKWIYLYR